MLEAWEQDQRQEMREERGDGRALIFFSHTFLKCKSEIVKGKKGILQRENSNQCQLLVFERVTAHPSCHQEAYHCDVMLGLLV